MFYINLLINFLGRPGLPISRLVWKEGFVTFETKIINNRDIFIYVTKGIALQYNHLIELTFFFTK